MKTKKKKITVEEMKFRELYDVSCDLCGYLPNGEVACDGCCGRVGLIF